MSPVLASAEAVTSADLCARLEANIAQIIRGKTLAIHLAVLALIGRGHLLIEDVPGVGKTTLARAFAASLGGTFHRIQFTSDLLPSDIIGVSVFNAKTTSFEFKPGALFANVVLADEINRTTPRTQSALLEAMNDGQVSVDGYTHRLDLPFFVIATQNPEEHYGTYPLPESQMDRFILRIRLDYPAADDERRLLLENGGPSGDALGRLPPALSPREVVSLQEAADRVRLSPELADYIVAVAHETRRSPFLSLGISPRAELAWRNVARAAALCDGRDFVLPDDLKSTAQSALAHRLILANQLDSTGRTRHEAERVLADIFHRLVLPG